VSPRAVLDAVVKRTIPSPRRESNPRTPIVQPVAQRYISRVMLVPVTTAWRGWGGRIRTPDMEGGCEYIERAVVDSRGQPIRGGSPVKVWARG
jgi:hypothetical protein